MDQKDNRWFYSCRLDIVDDTLSINHIGQVQVAFESSASAMNRYALHIKEAVIRDMILNLFARGQHMVSELYVNLIRSNKIRPTVNEVLFTLSVIRHMLFIMTQVAPSDVDGYDEFQKFIYNAREKIDMIGEQFADIEK